MTTRKPPEDPRGLPPGQERGAPVTLELDGQPVRAFEGETVAAALWADGVQVLSRSPKYHRPRGAFCMTGTCASCYLRIDGRPNLRACLTPVRDGLRCERQNAFPDAEIDVLRAADWLFPQGMDHHHLMTGTRVGNALFKKLVRQMGGSGTLPDAPAVPAEAPVARTVDVCIVGAGPAGLSAAAVLLQARPGTRVLVVDEQTLPGGSLLAYPGGVARGRDLAAAATGAELLLGTTAIAHYAEDPAPTPAAEGPPGVLALATASRLVTVSARRFLYATGAYDQNLVFAGNDAPHVLSARACGRLAFRFGIVPGRRVLIASDPALPWSYADHLERGLGEHGIRVGRIALDGTKLPPARGATIAAAALPSPAAELPRQHGVPVRFDAAAGGFCVVAQDDGSTQVPGVFVAGDVTGVVGPERAARAGALVGARLAASL